MIAKAGQGPDRATYTYERLRDLIIEGKLSAGTRLLETEVAARLDVSRTPVRAALQRLEHEGYLATEPEEDRRSTPVVAPLTKEDARELFAIVGALEGVAARRVADRADGEREPIAHRLAGANETLREEACKESPDPDRLFDLDWAFHEIFVEEGAGSRLLRIHGGTKPQTERYTRTYIYGMTEEFLRSVEEHEALVAAVRDGDPDAAAAATFGNWQRAGERLCQVIDRLGERGVW